MVASQDLHILWYLAGSILVLNRGSGTYGNTLPQRAEWNISTRIKQATCKQQHPQGSFQKCLFFGFRVYSTSSFSQPIHIRPTLHTSTASINAAMSPVADPSPSSACCILLSCLGRTVEVEAFLNVSCAHGALWSDFGFTTSGFSCGMV